MKFKLLKYVNNIWVGGSSAIVSVGVFYVWPKQLAFFQCGPGKLKG
jgi:hypothetical protein